MKAYDPKVWELTDAETRFLELSKGVDDSELPSALEKANNTLQEEIQRIQQTLDADVRTVIDGAKSTFKAISRISYAAVAMGIILIVAPILLVVFMPDQASLGIETFGLSGLGVLDLFALYFYRPMDRMQKASVDFTQHIMTTQSWIMTSKMILRSMVWADRESVMLAASRLENSTKRHVILCERLIQQSESET